MSIRVLTNEIIDKRLEGRNIKRVGDYKVNEKTKFKCKKESCGHEWSSFANHVINQKTGCPKCAHNAMITDEQVDSILSARNIRRLDKINGQNKKYRWECKKESCGFIWEMTLACVLRRTTGCPECAKKVRYTNEYVDYKTTERPLTRMEEVKGKGTPIKWRCKKEGCQYEWYARPTDIIRKNQNCPKCSNHIPLTNEEVDFRIKERNIQRLDTIQGIGNKNKWKCLVPNCGYEWITTPRSIIHQKSKCPKCIGNLPLTDDDIDNLLKERNIQRLDHIEDSHEKTRWKCLNKDCDNIWLARANNIIANNSGCPICKTLKSQKTIYTYLKTIISPSSCTYNKERLYYTHKNYFRLDFFIKPNIIIEYNGIQHYLPTRFGGISEEGAVKRLKIQQLRDANLRKYCQEHNYPLLEIPYTMKEEEWKIVIKEFLEKNCKKLLK